MKKQYIAPTLSVYDIAPCVIMAYSNTGTKVDNRPADPNAGNDAARFRQSDWSDYESF